MNISVNYHTNKCGVSLLLAAKLNELPNAAQTPAERSIIDILDSLPAGKNLHPQTTAERNSRRTRPVPARRLYATSGTPQPAALRGIAHCNPNQVHDIAGRKTAGAEMIVQCRGGVRRAGIFVDGDIEQARSEIESAQEKVEHDLRLAATL